MVSPIFSSILFSCLYEVEGLLSADRITQFVSLRNRHGFQRTKRSVEKILPECSVKISRRGLSDRKRYSIIKENHP